MEVKKRSRGPTSEINVTPLVDVCLVLLIIFMVITPMLQKGVEVRLPRAESAESKKRPEDDTVVAIRADGSLFLDMEMVTEDDLLARIRGIHIKEPFRPILLKGDERLRFRDVRKVLEILNDAGIKKIGFATETSTPGTVSRSER